MMVTKATLCALSVLVAIASGNSLGLGVPTCDTDDTKIWKKLPSKCTKEKALGGDKCGSGLAMWWATAPEHTDDFVTSVTYSPTGGTPSKSYTPGGLMYVHVRATKQNLKYRGLLLYAEDSKGKKAGSWELPYEEEQMFHTPPGHCDGKAVMHSGAGIKHYHHAFPFRAPTGTGTLTFKTLLKSGPANTGAFHWANKGGPLQLSVRTKSTPPSWFKAAPGQTCTKACANLGGTCNQGKLEQVSSQSKFLAGPAKNVACKLPILKGCARADPAEEVEDGFCRFHDPSCNKEQPSCGKSDPSLARMCACSGVTASEGQSKKESLTQADQCDSYCSAKPNPCDWTKKWKCPWAASKGSKRAGNGGGGAGYNCCCVQNTKQGGCGKSGAKLLDEDAWTELAQEPIPLCESIINETKCAAASCVWTEEDGSAACGVDPRQLHDMAN